MPRSGVFVVKTKSSSDPPLIVMLRRTVLCLFTTETLQQPGDRSKTAAGSVRSKMPPEDPKKFYQFLERAKQRKRFNIRAPKAAQIHYVLLGGAIAAWGVYSLFFAGQRYVDQYRLTNEARRMKNMGELKVEMRTEWWENEWMKRTMCCDTENDLECIRNKVDLVKTETGVDLEDLSTLKNKSGEQPTMFIPLCGASRIVRVFAELGFEVTALDASITAVRHLIDKIVPGLSADAGKNINIINDDFFRIPLEMEGQIPRSQKFDIIYDRRAMTSVVPQSRNDYAFILKQHLKEDGIVIVEGIFRTGRVKGNKAEGPPFGLSQEQLQELFPSDDGFAVKCGGIDEKVARQLSREAKIYGEIPKEMYVSDFPCVVFKEKELQRRRAAI